MNRALRRRSRFVLTMGLLLVSLPADAAVYEIFPTGMTSNCNEEFENIANSLRPGDELILHDGIYAQGCARRIKINGTASQPITIRAADGASPLLTRPPETSSRNNNIELSGAHYTISGLRFQYGSAGVRFLASHHITFENNEIFDTLNNALTMNQAHTDSHVIRNNHIHHTGLGSGSTEGEGMYIGSHSGNYVATNHLIENNYIHHLRSTSEGGNDGIEIKFGSGGNIIRSNVIHDTNIGRTYPCIFVYGHGTAPNIVENNKVYNCGEAILATADAIIRNNVVLDSSINGIHLNRQNPAPSVRNVTIVNNTVYGHPVCAQLNIADAANIVVANNAFYCEGATAVAGSGFPAAAIEHNYAAGEMSGGAGIDNAAFFDGGAAASAFVSPANGDFHLAENSALIDAGSGNGSDAGNTDFDGNARVAGSAIDVGAFEYDGGPRANPPTGNLAGPSTNPSSVNAMLQRVSTDVDSCTAAA